MAQVVRFQTCFSQPVPKHSKSMNSWDQPISLMSSRLIVWHLDRKPRHPEFKSPAGRNGLSKAGNHPKTCKTLPKLVWDDLRSVDQLWLHWFSGVVISCRCSLPSSTKFLLTCVCTIYYNFSIIHIWPKRNLQKPQPLVLGIRKLWVSNPSGPMSGRSPRFWKVGKDRKYSFHTFATECDGVMCPPG